MNELTTTMDEKQLEAMGLSAADFAGAVPGMELVRPDDFQMPRLTIAQAMSHELRQSSPKYIEGLKSGDFFNTVSSQIYGSKLEVVPIKYNFNRLYFVDNKLDCQSKNGLDGGHHSPVCATCELSKWGSGPFGQGTACKEYRNFLVMILPSRDLASMSFKSASLQASKGWVANIMMQKAKVNGHDVTLPPWTRVYELKSVEKVGQKGTYFVPVVSLLHPASGELSTEAGQVFKRFKEDIIAVEDSD